MRFIWQPQAQVVDSGSWRISRRAGWPAGVRVWGLACLGGLPLAAWPARSHRPPPQVLIQRFIEQALLLGAEALRLRGELHALEQRVLVRELVDQRLLEDRLLALASITPSRSASSPINDSSRSHLRAPGVKVVCGDHERR
jgi:hypothetical protein